MRDQVVTLWQMVEAFGLDRRIENNRGTRPVGLYRWDLDVLIDVIGMALADSKAYPRRAGPGYEALNTLHVRLQQLSNQAYSDLRKG